MAEKSYINNTFRVALVDAPGSDFDATDSLSTILANEVTSGLGGYSRQQIGYTSADLDSYNNGRRALARKAATFVHNGNTAETVRFSHVVLLNPTETAAVAVTKLSARATLSDGQSAIFYFDLTLYGVFVVE
ncbi:hypothetical protein SynSYN20_01663 [Synechococcus sp. SYN20]|nr:hypothetical protein SynSYN20_01663 [Synechococcus sp. SYN20]